MLLCLMIGKALIFTLQHACVCKVYCASLQSASLLDADKLYANYQADNLPRYGMRKTLDAKLSVMSSDMLNSIYVCAAAILWER
jgi:hypothetical protein